MKITAADIIPFDRSKRKGPPANYPRPEEEQLPIETVPAPDPSEYEMILYSYDNALAQLQETLGNMTEYYRKIPRGKEEQVEISFLMSKLKQAMQVLGEK